MNLEKIVSIDVYSIISHSCGCLFDGNIRQNTKKLQRLMRSYQQIYEELAKYFTRGDFAVETVPALLSLPPQIRSGFCLQTRHSILGSVCPMKNVST